MNKRDIDDAAVGAYGPVAETTLTVRTAVVDGVVQDVQPVLRYHRVVRGGQPARSVHRDDPGNPTHG